MTFSRPKPRELGRALHGLRRHGSMVVLRSLEQPRHPLHRVGRRIRVAHVVEELEECLCGPLAGQAQQVEQIPHLDRVDLHGGRSEQHETPGTVLERPHQPE